MTGGTGFIGQEIVDFLLDQGHEVICVDYWEEAVTRAEKERYPIISSLYATLPRCVAVTRPDKFLYDFESRDISVDVIVHAGAVVNTQDLGDGPLFQQNVTYTTELARVASRLAVGMIFLSSAATYGTNAKPNNPYGLSKILDEVIVNGMKSRTTNLRLFNVFGRNEHHKGPMASVPFKLAQAYRGRTAFPMHSPDASRDFVPVTSVAAAVAFEVVRIALGDPKNNQHMTWDVGTGESTTFADLDLYISQAMRESQSFAAWGPMPEVVAGRFQGYTRAGHMANIEGFAPVKNYPLPEPRITTREGIAQYYGK